MKTKRTLMLTTTCALLAIVFTQPARAQTINPGIIDPTNTYAGKTYAEWAAAWWQHFMSLSATNTPYHRSAPYPDAPLSTGQSGPVWFMLGNFLPGGTYTYTDTIPGGVGLFVPMTENWGDNTGCPPTSYSESVLRAMAKSGEDGASGMSCTIDGVAVRGLTNVLTTPYRVQSIVFSYTCPAVHNMLSDVFGETCYSNNAGTPYTINGVIEDGVFLMVAPLSAGKHVVHGTWAFPPSLSESWTRNLTVLPVALTVNASAQPENLILSWPQTPDNYTVQSSPSLSPPDWQSANLVITTNNGILQATAPVGTTNQLFRLQLN
jgi:hypothetical protein